MGKDTKTGPTASRDEPPARNDEVQEELESKVLRLLNEFYRLYQLAENDPSVFFQKWPRKLKRAEWSIFHPASLNRGVSAELRYVAEEALSILSGASTEFGQGYHRPPLTPKTLAFFETKSHAKASSGNTDHTSAKESGTAHKSYEKTKAGSTSAKESDTAHKSYEKTNSVFPELIAKSVSFSELEQLVEAVLYSGELSKQDLSATELAFWRVQNQIISIIVEKLFADPHTFPEELVSAVKQDFGLREKVRQLAMRFQLLATELEQLQLSNAFIKKFTDIVNVIGNVNKMTLSNKEENLRLVGPYEVDTLIRLLHLQERWLTEIPIQVDITRSCAKDLPSELGLKKTGEKCLEEYDKKILDMEADSFDPSNDATWRSGLAARPMKLLRHRLERKSSKLASALGSFENELKSKISGTSSSQEILAVVEDLVADDGGPLALWNKNDTEVIPKVVLVKMVAFLIEDAVRVASPTLLLEFKILGWQKYHAESTGVFNKVKNALRAGSKKSLEKQSLRTIFECLTFNLY